MTKILKKLPNWPKKKTSTCELFRNPPLYETFDQRATKYYSRGNNNFFDKKICVEMGIC